jgi:WD40 repeat protein
LWSIETKKEIAHLEVEDSFAEVVGFTAEGSDLIISEELNAKVLIWNCMNKKNRLTLEIGNTGPIAVSPDGRTLAVVPRKTQNVRLWSLVTGKELFPDFQDGHASGIVSLVFSPDSKHVASASFWDSTLYWDMRTEKPKYKINDRGFRLLSFLPSGNNLIMFPGERVSDGNGLLVWDRDLRKTTRLIAGSEKELLPGELKLAVLVDNAKTLVTVGKKGDAFSDPNALVVIWDLAKQTRLREFAIADISAHSLAASSDGSIAAIGTYNGEIVLVNLSNGKTIMTLEAGEDPQDVVLALGSRMVVSWVTKDKISAWELLTGKEIFHLQHKCKLRSAMAISSDGCWLATTDGHRIWIWDLILGKPTIEFSNFDSEITCLAFSPDGMVLGSGCNNSTILLWDTSSLAASRRDLPVVDKKCLLSCWDNLASVDARKGHESMWMLIASPQQTVPYLRAKLAPARSIPEKRFRQLVSELDDDDYQVRDSAFQNLACQEEQITQRLRNELDNNLTAEQRSRIEKLLDLPPIVRTPDRMRSLRAVQILERIGNSDAKAVLKILTTGAPEARLTQEAKESIIRLEACEKLKVP